MEDGLPLPDSTPPGVGPALPARPDMLSPLRQQVFEAVRASGQVARADLARALGVSAGSVTAITADLIAEGLLREVIDQPRETGRGRPPVALEVVPDSHLVIGIKLSDDGHSAALTDFAGNIVADASFRTSTQRKPLAAMTEETTCLINILLDKAGVALTDISAIGVGISGIVDHDTGTVPWSPLLTETDVPLGAAFSAAFGCPVLVDNDANMLTLAELWFGNGRTLPDFAVVTVEHGVGMGLVLDNRLFRGGRGMGLELGHIKVQLDGALCRCGQRGCLEAYLADYALGREAATALGLSGVSLHSASTSLDTLFDAAKAGNEAALTIFKRAGRFLAVGLANVVQLFDPPLIILTGERMRFDYLYSDEVMEEMRRLTLNAGRRPSQVKTHAWGDLVWARGATALALSAVTAAQLGG